jgi:hypothetical protein
MITVYCHECGKPFTEATITAAMSDRRVHMEQRHLEGEIETDLE